jgi:hypothetical protein
MTLRENEVPQVALNKGERNMYSYIAAQITCVLYHFASPNGVGMDTGKWNR